MGWAGWVGDATRLDLSPGATPQTRTLLICSRVLCWCACLFSPVRGGRCDIHFHCVTRDPTNAGCYCVMGWSQFKWPLEARVGERAAVLTVVRMRSGCWCGPSRYARRVTCRRRLSPPQALVLEWQCVASRRASRLFLIFAELMAGGWRGWAADICHCVQSRTVGRGVA